MPGLRVSIVQSTLVWEDKAANLAQFDEKLAELKGKSDLIVLPEMFTTGFSMRAAALAEPMHGPTMEWLASQAASLGQVITGSFIAEDKGRYFNRLVWMRPDQTFSTYDKRHLFSLAEEHQHYTQGLHHLVVEYKGWNIMPLICYDLRFPVWSRNVKEVDLLLYVANWPSPRRRAWSTLLAARAIENQCYTIGVNRVGEDPKGNLYTGDSAIVDFTGEVLCALSQNEAVLTLELHREPQDVFRTKFPFLRDRDHFSIHR